MRDRRTVVNDLVQRIQGSLDEFDRTVKESGDLRTQYQSVLWAHTVCGGKGRIKVNLPRWVLGRELDRVAQAATVRLLKMTNGRYSLRRRELAMENRSERGLDLEVFDSHTGVARVPKSLSGGEQFQASLALALGLADVVSHGASGSGQRSHALFIDEGFGSLDPRALDDVIDTLQQLQATGRMVGAITHVPEMKERLHQGIVVSKRQDGRGSTLRVNP
jgi:exonuclease SbcC